MQQPIANIHLYSVPIFQTEAEKKTKYDKLI
jgi:hypothetical protein